MMIDYFDYFLRFKEQVDAIIELNYRSNITLIINKLSELIVKVNHKKSHKFRMVVEDSLVKIKLTIYESFKSSDLYKYDIDIKKVKRRIKLENMLNNIK